MHPPIGTAEVFQWLGGHVPRPLCEAIAEALSEQRKGTDFLHLREGRHVAARRRLLRLDRAELARLESSCILGRNASELFKPQIEELRDEIAGLERRLLPQRRRNAETLELEGRAAFCWLTARRYLAEAGYPKQHLDTAALRFTCAALRRMGYGNYTDDAIGKRIRKLRREVFEPLSRLFGQTGNTRPQIRGAS